MSGGNEGSDLDCPYPDIGRCPILTHTPPHMPLSFSVAWEPNGRTCLPQETQTPLPSQGSNCPGTELPILLAHCCCSPLAEPHHSRNLDASKSGQGVGDISFVQDCVYWLKQHETVNELLIRIFLGTAVTHPYNWHILAQLQGLGLTEVMGKLRKDTQIVGFRSYRLSDGDTAAPWKLSVFIRAVVCKLPNAATL